MIDRNNSLKEELEGQEKDSSDKLEFNRKAVRRRESYIGDIL